MWGFRKYGLLASFALIASLPANVAQAGQTIDQAEKLRKLDIMLMVSSLRCRTGESDFRPEYQRFSTRHSATMIEASRTLKAQWTARQGAKGAARQLDKLSIAMANKYGQGHPWMECADLKRLAADLAEGKDAPVLLSAADEYLGDNRGRVYLAAAQPGK